MLSSSSIGPIDSRVSIATFEQLRTPSGATPTLELSVVMPCLNEEKTVAICVEKAVRTMRELGIAGEVVIVDNGSTDQSVAVAEAAGARVVYHPLKGYGNALRRGFAEAQGRYIIMGDCDDSYDFTDLKRYVDCLRGGAELVMGNRLKGHIKPGAMPWLHRYVGNPLLSGFLNLLFKTGVGDSHCGMRGFRKDAVTRMNLQMPGMELASEMVIKSSLAGLKIDEIPITLSPDGRDRRPHLRSFRDGWRHLRFMLMCSPSFLFFLPGMLLLVLGLSATPIAALAGYGVWTDHFGPNFMYTASLVALTGFHVLVFGFLAKLTAHRLDPVFFDRRLEKITRWFRIERGFLIGGSLIATAALIATPVIIHWVQTSELLAPLWIFSGTLFVIGLETIFLAFLVGIIDMARESHRHG
ncbi:MAG: glycosyltransferase family 2 protein [Planctomycetes bacterium]|nr:glycosyltransferase family 2 protein [Planctomycetota bacterium]